MTLSSYEDDGNNGKTVGVVTGLNRPGNRINPKPPDIYNPDSTGSQSTGGPFKKVR